VTEKTIRLVGIQDLKTIRVHCKKCETIFEVAMEKLGTTFGGANIQPSCPKCREDLHGYRENENAFNQFQHALKRLAESNKFDVEFVIEMP
jgi:hypothetical protein